MVTKLAALLSSACQWSTEEMTAKCRENLLSGLVQRFLNVTYLGTRSGMNKEEARGARADSYWHV